MAGIDLRRTCVAVLLAGVYLLTGGFSVAVGQSGPPAPTQTTPPKTSGSDAQVGLGQKNTPNQPKTGEDQNSAAKPASSPEQAASTKKLKLGPLDPSVPPSGLPTNRPVVGLALGGGAALAISEIGTLQWLDEHHVPVDVIAGTSMGSILAALYSTGVTPEQMKHILNPDEVGRIFRIQAAYSARSFRRREDALELPNGIGIGLKHGVSMRNSLLTDTGLNELLDKEFIRYNDQIDFNDLPIPFRCRSTDLTAAKSVVFSRGSLQDAVRASASLPGVFQPFEMDGHEYVDGAILDNLPTSDVKAMGADVIIAFSLPLSPVGKGDLDSIVGVLQRAFAVGIEVNEERDRKLANIVIMPDIQGFTASDYSKTEELAARGYAAAEAHKAELMKYALNDAQWEAYMAKRHAKERPPVGTVLEVKVKAPTKEVEAAVYRKFDPLVNQPIDTHEVESLLADIRADGRYNADYTVGYDSAGSNRPILLIDVEDKKNGPPFAHVGFNIEAQTGGVTRATIDSILLYQDFGGYGSELRGKIDLGFLTELEGEYFHRFTPSGFFAAPRVNLTREPFYIYAPNSNERLSERQSQFGGVAGDVGWTDTRERELRVGWSFNNVQWYTTTGFDNLPNYRGNAQTVRAQYIFDSQDTALVPTFGVRLVSRMGYLYGTGSSPSAPQFYTQLDDAYTWNKKNVFLAKAEGATMFNRDVAQPFRYTLGGPLRLSAEAIDQIRGTDYWLVTPGYMRQVLSLPQPLGQHIYLGGAFEAGQMRSPDGPTFTSEDVYFGVVAETPLGVITFAPSFGFQGQRKFVFTIGRFF
ncbi:MAG TPA: patatin-like phospholipase family protein [Candidatus Aquilonibacter sp.]|nr:patatin-like phospholipase family protein [Candidatus Aquilonibacter sp.]